MKKLILVLVCFPLLLAIRCNPDEGPQGIPCSNEARAGLNVTVSLNDSSTNVTDGVTVIATDGDFSETLETPVGNSVFSGVYERPGTYILTVSKEGFETHTSDPIVVGRDACHVIPRSVHVNLQPL